MEKGPARMKLASVLGVGEENVCGLWARKLVESEEIGIRVIGRSPSPF